MPTLLVWKEKVNALIPAYDDLKDLRYFLETFVAKGFWEDPENQRSLLTQIGSRLGLRDVSNCVFDS